MERPALRHTVLRVIRVATVLQGFMVACVVRPGGGDAENGPS